MLHIQRNMNDCSRYNWPKCLRYKISYEIVEYIIKI